MARTTSQEIKKFRDMCGDVILQSCIFKALNSAHYYLAKRLIIEFIDE